MDALDLDKLPTLSVTRERELHMTGSKHLIYTRKSDIKSNFVESFFKYVTQKRMFNNNIEFYIKLSILQIIL